MPLKRSIDGERERGEGGGGVGGKMSGPSTSSLSVITVTTFFLAIIKRALFGLACVACLAVQGEHAKGRGGLLFFSLIVRPRHFFFFSPAPPPPPQKKASATQSMIGYGEGTYSLEFMRVSKQGMNLPETDQGLGFVRVTLCLL